MIYLTSKTMISGYSYFVNKRCININWLSPPLIQSFNYHSVVCKMVYSSKGRSVANTQHSLVPGQVFKHRNFRE